MADSRDILGKNRKFKGTDSITLPKGTEAQRVGGESGELRFNTDTNLAEYYDGTDWKPIDAPPTITGFTVDGGSSVTSADISRVAGDASIVISGSNFDVTSATVVFEPESGGSNVSTQTITRTNSSSFTVTVTRTDFLTANDPYAIKLTNGSGLTATLASAITANDLPVFSTAADTEVAEMYEGKSAAFGETTLAATDAESDTITYSISAGALPPGVTINSSTAALEGTVSSSSIQVYTFTVQAATAGGNSTRQFTINNTVVPFVTATGGTIATSGDYKVHTFTSPGTFTVSNAGNPAGSNSVEYLVVAGGGGGGTDRAGGGGGGGYRENYPSPATGGLPVTATSYPITVGTGGAGGSGGSGPGETGSRGNNSIFSTITSTGGGGGSGGNVDGTGTQNGQPGGSGGGGGHCSGTGYTTTGGSGNTPPVSPSQGNRGGNTGDPQGGGAGGGGGGAGQAGADSPPGTNGSRPGGNGSATSITGTAVTRAGGGGGGGESGGGTGGSGGGGAGKISTSPSQGNPGTANTGGGGGSGGQDANSGGSGGSGIVILRYKFQ